MHSKISLILTTIGSFAFLVSTTVSPAFAQENEYNNIQNSEDNVSQPLTTIDVPLDLDCSSVPNTPEAQAILTQHNLCGYGRIGGNVTPNAQRNEVRGTCGTLSLYLNNARSGNVGWKARITSSLGFMVNASYSGELMNNDTGLVTSVSRSSGPILTADWNPERFTRYIGPGTVYGKIYFAKSTLIWGASCTNNDVVYDYANVTQ